MRQDESRLQQQCIALFKIQYPLYRGRLWAIPNGGHRHIVTAQRLKREGLTAGVPDLMLSVPMKGYGGMFLELKTSTGTMSLVQKEFFKKHEAAYYCVTVRSVENFMQEVAKYLR